MGVPARARAPATGPPLPRARAAVRRPAAARIRSGRAVPSQDTRLNPPATAHEAGTPVRAGLGVAGLSFAVNGTAGLVGAVVTSRLYGVDIIGQYALVAAPWIMLIQLSSLAEGVAFVREAATLPPRSRRLTGLFLPMLAFSTVFTAAVGAVVFLGSVLVLRGPADQPDLVAPMALVLVGYLLLENVSANLDGVLSAFRAAKELFASRLTQTAGFPLLATILYAWVPTVWGLTIATLGSFVAALAVRLVAVPRYLRLTVPTSDLVAGARALPDLLRFGMRVVPGRLATGFALQSSTWVLGAAAPLAVVGAWSRAFQLSMRMNEAGYRLEEILYPALSQRHRSGDMDGYRRLLRRTVRLGAVVLLGVAAPTAGAAEGVLTVFGEGFSEAAPAFAVLLVAMAVAVISSLIGQATIAAGHPTAYSTMAIGRAALSLGLLVPGALVAGATGAAVAIAAGVVLEIGIRVWFFEHRVCAGANPSTATALRIAVAVGAGMGVARLVDTTVPGPGGVAAALALGAAAYAGAALLTGAVHPEDRVAVTDLARAARRRAAGSRPVAREDA